jgi:citrate lyase subunit beta/citryl-CoA lyase
MLMTTLPARTTLRPRRSALYMPASNARAVEKARTLDADVVILDLEDAVSPDMKEAARAQAIAAVREGGFGRSEVIIRINGPDTAWGKDDLAALAGVSTDGVLIPKVSETSTLADARAVLSADGPALWAMIETTRGVANLPLLADSAADHGLIGFVVGTNDLAKEMRSRPGMDRAPLLPILTQIVLCARMAGLVALDGVCNALDDEAVLEAECRQGLNWGFDGKTLIHPSQIAPAHRAFTPTADEIAWAREIVQAFDAPENAGKGAIRVAGKMIELLHRDEAQRTLALAEMCGA